MVPVGLRKPDPRIFCLALDLLGVAPDAVLFADDKQRNVTVAREMGMTTGCWIGRLPSPPR